MRGTQLVQFHPSEPRFIPAGAGNTSSSNSLIRLAAVYPRWRGEHNERNNAQAFWSGLSPLARGTPNGSDVRRLRYRFIPAGAGNTVARYRWQPARTVYPRWRGEHRILNRGGIHFGGLSPLARGTQYIGAGDTQLTRFIPAGAGNTRSVTATLAKISVYPRWRGEHSDKKNRTVLRYGLSPLARGTPGGAVFFSGRRRFIPAGAGNTGRSSL